MEVEAPWPLDLARKWSTDKKPSTKRCYELEENILRRAGDTRDMDETAMGKTPGTDRDLVAGQGRRRGVERTPESAGDASTRRVAQSKAAESGG